MAAMNDHEQEHLEKRRQLENALEQARFEAARAHRQYDQVDPDNRLVAGELERRWNMRLANVRTLEEQLAQYNGGHIDHFLFDQEASALDPVAENDGPGLGNPTRESAGRDRGSSGILARLFARRVGGAPILPGAANVALRRPAFGAVGDLQLSSAASAPEKTREQGLAPADRAAPMLPLRLALSAIRR